MIGSIERVRRHIPVRLLLPFLVLAIAWRNPIDPTRKINGYGGVLPVPAPSATAQSGARPDSAADRREQRPRRGRILYATGRAPQVTPAQRADSAKPRCEARVSQSRTASSLPNS